MKLNWKHYLIIGIAILLAISGFVIMRGLIVSWTFTDLPGIALVDNSNPENGGESDAEITPEAVIPPSELPPAWDGASRVNILVMGLDYGDWAADRQAFRTDSMIPFTIDLIKTADGFYPRPVGTSCLIKKESMPTWRNLQTPWRSPLPPKPWRIWAACSALR
jgi:hypothetical protein